MKMMILSTKKVSEVLRIGSNTICRPIATSQYRRTDESDPKNIIKEKFFKTLNARDRKKLDSIKDKMKKANIVFNTLSSFEVAEDVKNKTNEKNHGEKWDHVKKLNNCETVISKSEILKTYENMAKEPEKSIDHSLKLKELVENTPIFKSNLVKPALSKPTQMGKLNTLKYDLITQAKNTLIDLKIGKESVEEELLEAFKNILVVKNDPEHRSYSENKMHKKSQSFSFAQHPRLGIFNDKIQELEQPALATWDYLYKLNLANSFINPPQNYFEELILWTKQGKIWNFPIDNEQGWDEEQKVDFTDHIFLDNHLEPWCPKSGPLRHFMELVTVGLSKNPYISSDKKKEHIMWFKNYFETHRILLTGIGVMETESVKSVNVPE